MTIPIQVANLYTDEASKYTFKRPITVVALDPRYGARKTRELVTGDVRGRLKISSQVRLGVTWLAFILQWGDRVGRTWELVTGDVRGQLKTMLIATALSPKPQGWLGRSDHTLHQGEGAIQAVAWQGVTLAWANELGVKVGGGRGWGACWGVCTA